MKFIVLEGIDSSGKSTQADLLREYFRNRGEKSVISSEPTNGPVGKLIRKAMQSPLIPMEDRKIFDEQMAYLFAADRHYHLYNDHDGVFYLINQKQTHVISTRYYFSSLAYNCSTEEEYQFVYQLNSKFPNPDLVIYINLPVEESLKRLAERESREVYEHKEKLIEVSQNFEKIFSLYEGNLLKIDGTDTIPNIHEQIINRLDNGNREWGIMAKTLER